MDADQINQELDRWMILMLSNIIYATLGALLLSPLIPYGLLPYLGANVLYGVGIGYARFVWQK
jgi:hypothetical protein